MSDDETHIIETDGQMLTAEYKDGHLQIVEVAPFDKGNESSILPDITSEGEEQTKYLQVLDTSKGLVHLDLLNFTLVKCDDDEGSSSYQVMGTSSSEDGDTTLTCVIADDNEVSDDNQDSYVIVNTEEGQEPLVFLQSSLQQINRKNIEKEPDANVKKKTLTPTEILEKAKALQKAKSILQLENANRSNSRGRKRKSDLLPPMELLASPNFKLFLYSCKLCSFKCNAIKEMSQHKASEHGAGKPRGVTSRGGTLQCARCPYRGTQHTQLMKHVQEEHIQTDDDDDGELKLDCGDISDAHVLVCGACGFESEDRNVFKKHIEKEHGVNVMLEATIMTEDDTSESN